MERVRSGSVRRGRERARSRSAVSGGEGVRPAAVSRRLVRRAAWLIGLVAVAEACEGGASETLVVRTDMPASLRDRVAERFESQTPGVAIRFTEGSVDETLAELNGEGAAPFDVWWGAPALALQRAADVERLAPYRPPWAAEEGAIGEAAGPEGTSAVDDWQATRVTPFVIAFNREALPISRAPSEWSDLLHFRWVDEIVALDPTRSPEGAWFLGAMAVEALRDDDDLNRGLEWMGRLDEQVVRWVADPSEAIRAMRSGEAMIAIMPRAFVEQARAEEAPWIHYRIPGSGAPMLVRGVAIVRGTSLETEARRFVDLVGASDLATEVTVHTHWEPAHGEVVRAMLPPDFMMEYPWTGYPLATDTLSAELDGWVDRWDLEFRKR